MDATVYLTTTLAGPCFGSFGDVVLLPGMAEQPPKVSKASVRQVLASDDDPAAFDRVAAFYAAMNTEFAKPRNVSGWLTPNMPLVARKLVRLSKVLGDDQRLRCAELLRRTFQIVLADRGGSGPPSAFGAQQDGATADDGSKRTIAFKVAILLFRLYFWSRNMVMVNTIARNIVSAGVKFGDAKYATRADRVAYRYYLGRYYLSELGFRRARAHLLYAWQNCRKQASTARQARSILVYLIVAGLPMGIFPSIDMLQYTGMAEVFAPLTQAARLGDWRTYHAHVDRHRDLFDRYEVSLILEQRLDLLLYRSIVRRSFMVHRDIVGPQNGPPNMPIERVHRAVLLATGFPAEQDDGRHAPWDLLDTELLLVSLIDAGLMRGYLVHDRKLLVLDGRDKQKFGFPDPSGVQLAQMEDDDELQFGPAS